MAHGPADIRNFALIGHGDSGKTSLVDAIAYLAKATPRHGSVQEGSSISNTEPEEKERAQTLSAHLFHASWKDRFLQYLDTPGHPDFLADAVSSLHAVESACLVVSASTGLTFHARRLFSEAEKAGVARAVVVTRPDAENTDFSQLLSDLVQAWGDRVVPVTYPDTMGRSFSRVLSSLDQEAPGAAEYRSALEERVAEADDALLEQYFEAGKLEPEEILRHAPVAMAAGKLIPVFTVQPDKEAGVAEFLDSVASLFPSPAQAAPRRALPAENAGEGDAIEVQPTEDGPLAGLVFKVYSDPYVGRLSCVRIFRGVLEMAHPQVWNARTGKNEKIGGLLRLQGKESSPVTRAVAGDIVAVAKVDTLNWCDTICAEGAPLRFPPIQQPKPMFSQAITPSARGDEQKISGAVEKLQAEDPTFTVRRDGETGEMVASGMSNLHLEILFAKLRRRYNVSVDTHLPRIPYRETVSAKADGHHRHKKQTGGRGQFGEVYLRVLPRERGAGFEFIDSVVGGSIPRQFIPEVEKGIRQAMAKGILAGYRVEDVAVELYDGKFHDVDSDQISFQIAGARAFADAFEKARPILLEPIMQLEIHVPARFTGDLTGNLNGRRGRLSGMDAEGDIQVIKAQVPLKEALDYSTQLRSITAGEGTFSMEFSHYEPVPPHLQAEIVALHRKEKGAED